MHPTAEAPGLWFFVISSNGGRAAADCAARYRDRNGGLVDLKKLDAAVAFMRQNWHMITDDESAYKPGVAERLAPVFKAAADGDPTWVDGLKKELRRYSQHIGWRVAGDLVRYASDYPGQVGRAVAALESPFDADLFWEIALTPIGGLERPQAGYKELRPPGARASVASLVLFSRDPQKYPVYRPQLSARPLESLLGEKLDRRSTKHLLVSYYAALERVGRLLESAGLKVNSNLDVQGVAWVLNYHKIV